jgi:uncharacterized protein (TIGR02996 family)
LIQTILDNPDDDVPRLVYADWQEEHGQTAHAELIRAQCALERLAGIEMEQRKKLERREKKLLRVPEIKSLLRRDHPDHYTREVIRGFHSLGEYQRGFVSHSFLNHSEFDRSKREGIQPYLDRILTIMYYWDRTSSLQVNSVKAFLSSNWLNRVVRLSMTPKRFSVQSLRLLGQCSNLTNLRWLELDSVLPLEAIAELILSPNLTSLTHIHLDGYFMLSTKHRIETKSDIEEVNAFVQKIVFSPRGRDWTRLIIDAPGIGESGMTAVLESPYLEKMEELRFSQTSISVLLKKNLRARFGNRICLQRIPHR